MEKEKLVHYVPADMVDRLKKLLVRLWETRNPASAQLGDILKEAEPEIRSLNETLFDFSAKERDTTIREKERNWAQEREKLRAESERALEELRAAASARQEKAKVSFACEKAELNEAVGRAQKEAEALDAENRRMKGRLEGQEAELKRRLFEAKAEFERESGRRVQEAVEQITGHLLLALKAAEQKLSDSSSEAARAKEENGRLRAALAERARRQEEDGARQAEELSDRERSLAAALAKAKELEKQLVYLKDGHETELRDKLRGKEAELNKAAAERLEFERADREAQDRRQEALLAKAGEDLKKAKKELEDLAAENLRLAEALAGREGELEKRLFEAGTEFNRESGRRVREAVEEITGRLLASLKDAEKKGVEAAAEAALAKEESSRLKASLAERERLHEESRRWQEEEAAAKDRLLAAGHGKLKELESRLLALDNERHAELLEMAREKESEFRRSLQEFEKERNAYLRSLADLKARFEDERSVWEAERGHIRLKAAERSAGLEAGLKLSLEARRAELERDYASRREALAGELRAKEAGLDREAAERLALERATWEARGKRQESLLAGAADDFGKAQKEIEALTGENRRLNGLLAELAKGGEYRDERQFQEAVARERERLAAGYEARSAALEAETKDLLAAYREKEKRWAAEKESCESELALCSVSTRSFIAEEERKLKADLAKWKEALEEEYKERLAEQLRARDVLLISEKARLTQEFMEKYAALEAKFESLRAGLGPKAGKPPGKKKRGA